MDQQQRADGQRIVGREFVLVRQCTEFRIETPSPEIEFAQCDQVFVARHPGRVDDVAQWRQRFGEQRRVLTAGGPRHRFDLVGIVGLEHCRHQGAGVRLRDSVDLLDRQPVHGGADADQVALGHAEGMQRPDSQDQHTELVAAVVGDAAGLDQVVAVVRDAGCQRVRTGGQIRAAGPRHRFQVGRDRQHVVRDLTGAEPVGEHLAGQQRG